MLAAALQLPPVPVTPPRDPHGYFSGLLDDVTDLNYWPVLEFDPAALDPMNCSTKLDNADWPCLRSESAAASTSEFGASRAQPASSPSSHSHQASALGNGQASHEASRAPAQTSLLFANGHMQTAGIKQDQQRQPDLPESSHGMNGHRTVRASAAVGAAGLAPEAALFRENGHYHSAQNGPLSGEQSTDAQSASRANGHTMEHMQNPGAQDLSSALHPAETLHKPSAEHLQEALAKASSNSLIERRQDQDAELAHVEADAAAASSSEPINQKQPGSLSPLALPWLEQMFQASNPQTPPTTSQNEPVQETPFQAEAAMLSTGVFASSSTSFGNAMTDDAQPPESALTYTEHALKQTSPPSGWTTVGKIKASKSALPAEAAEAASTPAAHHAGDSAEGVGSQLDSTGQMKSRWEAEHGQDPQESREKVPSRPLEDLPAPNGIGEGTIGAASRAGGQEPGAGDKAPGAASTQSFKKKKKVGRPAMSLPSGSFCSLGIQNPLSTHNMQIHLFSLSFEHAHSRSCCLHVFPIFS